MEVFLFPLVNVTLFPRTTKPLNVFEPRYLSMIREAVATRTPIAVGYIEDPALVSPAKIGEPISFVREIAGYGYPQIVEERVNGTLLIFLQGQGKLRLGKVLDRPGPYIVCEGVIIPEVNAVESTLHLQLSSLQRTLMRWVYSHIQDPMQQEMFMRNLSQPEEIVGAFASYMVRDYDLQQMVLEFNNINEKIIFLHRLMESSELTT